MILPLEAADGVDLGDAGRVAQLRPDHPVLQGAQVFGRVGLAVGTTCTRLGLDRVHEDFAQTRRDGAKLRRQA